MTLVTYYYWLNNRAGSPDILIWNVQNMRPNESTLRYIKKDAGFYNEDISCSKMLFDSCAFVFYEFLSNYIASQWQHLFELITIPSLRLRHLTSTFLRVTKFSLHCWYHHSNWFPYWKSLTHPFLGSLLYNLLPVPIPIQSYSPLLPSPRQDSWYLTPEVLYLYFWPIPIYLSSIGRAHS